MPVDPQIQALLDKGTGVPATHTLPVDVARAQYEARISLMSRPADIAGIREQTINGPQEPLRLRIYTPHGTGPFPLLVFFHGSGFVLCSLDTHDGMCRNLCAGAGCVVASVDYRLAPEHKFPAGPDDCLHTTRWTAAHAVELGADPTRIAVGGDSAGGQHGGGDRAPDARRAQSGIVRPAAALSGDRLPHTRHPLIRGERRGVRPDPRYNEVVLEPLSARPVGRHAPARRTAARPGSVRL